MSRAAAAAIVALTVLPVRAAGLDAAALARSPTWHLYAVEYARSHDVPVARLVRGGRGRVDMSWYFFVALGHGRVVLVDCGTDALARPGRAALRRRWSIARATPIRQSLARLGLAPDDVTDVVVTHPHWDHAGALGLFRDATLHVHRRAWGAIAGSARRAAEASGRADLLSGAETTLADGLRVREAGRHTAHQLFVEIDCEGRTVVVAGDAAYLYRNVEERRPVTVTVDAERNVADVQAAVRAVGRDDVLPGHDPAIFERYPSPTPGVAAICP